ncbi:MAG TPA: hypothetical protein P5164_03630 [Thermoanaerobaculia bacterium]|nr:hypothetical protein [Thermoanaerobaculia bacterium]
MSEAVRGVSRSSLGAALLVALLPWTTTGADEPLRPEVDPRLGGYVAQVVSRASRRFAEPGCVSLLVRFEDVRTGRPLSETLRTSGETPASHFAKLRFCSGDERLQCRGRETWAFTGIGSDSVFVCRSRFTALAKKSEKAAANILVHEALHTLGLGENPPTSREITAAVHDHCGR